MYVAYWYLLAYSTGPLSSFTFCGNSKSVVSDYVHMRNQDGYLGICFCSESSDRPI